MRFQVKRSIVIVAWVVTMVAATSWLMGENAYLALVVWAPTVAIVTFLAGAVGNWVDRRFSKAVNSEDPVWRRITHVVFVLALLLILTLGLVVVGQALIKPAVLQWMNY